MYTVKLDLICGSVLTIQVGDNPIPHKMQINTPTFTIKTSSKTERYEQLQFPIEVNLKSIQDLLKVADATGHVIYEIGGLNASDGRQNDTALQHGTPASGGRIIPSIEDPAVNTGDTTAGNSDLRTEQRSGKAQKPGKNAAATAGSSNTLGRKAAAQAIDVEKPRRVPKRLSNKLTAADRQNAHKVLDKLIASQHSPAFLRVLDHKEHAEKFGDLFLEYPKVVKEPISLEIIQTKISRDEYTCLKAIGHDVEIMAMKAEAWYNHRKQKTGKGQDLGVVLDGQELKKMWDKEIAKAVDIQDMEVRDIKLRRTAGLGRPNALLVKSSTRVNNDGPAPLGNASSAFALSGPTVVAGQKRKANMMPNDYIDKMVTILKARAVEATWMKMEIV